MPGSVPQRRLPALLPHLIWEPVLLVVVVAVTVLAAAQQPLFAGPALWWLAGIYGLLATGLALSVRTATPNLAIGALAVMSGATYGWLATEPGLPSGLAAVLAVLVVTLVGLVLGLLTDLLSVPAWAVSLAGLVVAFATVVGLVGVQPTRVDPPLRSAGVWVALFLVISVVGGACWALLPGLARWLGAGPVAGQPPRFRLNRLVAAVVGFTGSSLLAGLAGLAMASQTGVVSTDIGIMSLVIALAAVLIGGVSAAGGRGGITGTALGTFLLAVILTWLTIAGVGGSSGGALSLRYVIIGLVILVGLGVGRALSAISGMLSGPARPQPPVSASPPASAPPPLSAPPSSAPPSSAPPSATSGDRPPPSP